MDRANKYLWVSFFGGMAMMAKIVVGSWGAVAVLAAGCGWWAFSLYRVRTADPVREGLPEPPSSAEYRAAGVDMNLCSKCGKPLENLGYFLQGRWTEQVY